MSFGPNIGLQAPLGIRVAPTVDVTDNTKTPLSNKDIRSSPNKNATAHKRNETPEAAVFSLLQNLDPDMLQYIANFLPSLRDVCNLRRSFRSAADVENYLHRRYTFNINSISKFNCAIFHDDERLLCPYRCARCTTLLPSVTNNVFVVKCFSPYCMAHNVLKPVAPQVELTLPTESLDPGHLVLNIHKGHNVPRADQIIRWRQYLPDMPPGDWSVFHRSSSYGMFSKMVFPVKLDTDKLVEFSYKVRVHTCTCSPGKDNVVRPYQCYLNQTAGMKCSAIWSEWSDASQPVFPPNQEEVDFFKLKSQRASQNFYESIPFENNHLLSRTDPISRFSTLAHHRPSKSSDDDLGASDMDTNSNEPDESECSECSN